MRDVLNIWRGDRSQGICFCREVEGTYNPVGMIPVLLVCFTAIFFSNKKKNNIIQDNVVFFHIEFYEGQLSLTKVINQSANRLTHFCLRVLTLIRIYKS